jgi:hypothetical protein
MGGKGVKGIAGGGTVGASFPLFNGTGDVGANMSAAFGRWKGNGETQKIREFNLNRLKAMYTQGNKSFGIDFDPKDPKHNFMLNAKFNF